MLKAMNMEARLARAVEVGKPGQEKEKVTLAPPIPKMEIPPSEYQTLSIGKSASQDPIEHMSSSPSTSAKKPSKKYKDPFAEGVYYTKWQQHYTRNHWYDWHKFPFSSKGVPTDPEEKVKLHFCRSAVPACLLPYYLIHFHREVYTEWPEWCKEVAIYLKKTPSDKKKKPLANKIKKDKGKAKALPDVDDFAIEVHSKSSGRKRKRAPVEDFMDDLDEGSHVLSDDEVIHGHPPAQEETHRSAKKPKTTVKSAKNLTAALNGHGEDHLDILVEEPIPELDPVLSMVLGDLQARAGAAKTCGSKSSSPGGIKLLPYQITSMKLRTLSDLCRHLPCDEPRFVADASGVTFSWKGIFGKKKTCA